MERIAKTEAVKLLTENMSHFYGITRTPITDNHLDNLLAWTKTEMNDGAVFEMRTATKSSDYYIHFTGGSALDLGKKWLTAYRYECNGNIFIIVDYRYEDLRKSLIYLVPNEGFLEKLTSPLYK